MEQLNNNRKTYIIGNTNDFQDSADGQIVKVQLYYQILRREGFGVEMIELHNWKKKIFKLIHSIRKAIKEEANIIILGGPAGCRVTIPMVCRLNKKGKARVVFSSIGTGTLDLLLKKLTIEQANSFLACENFYGIKDKKMGKYLSKLSYVALENQKLQNAYISFYSLNNTIVLANFRDVPLKNRKYSHNENELNIVFLSRIHEKKGVLDLIDAVQEIRTKYSYNINLDIYGEVDLPDLEKEKFYNSLSNEIKYLNAVSSRDVVDVLRKYDLFCLPTKYPEGTPGAIVEAMIAGTPVLTSSFEQVKSLIVDGESGLVFKINDKNDLSNKIVYAYENKTSILPVIGKNGQKAASSFTYESNRDLFLKAMAGKD